MFPRNKLSVGVAPLINQMVVGLVALLFKECVDKRFFLSVFLCTNAIYGFSLSRLQCVNSFALLGQQFIVYLCEGSLSCCTNAFFVVVKGVALTFFILIDGMPNRMDFLMSLFLDLLKRLGQIFIGLVTFLL